MDKILTLEEVAELSRTHKSTIYRLLRKRGIPAFKMASEWRFSQESIEKWISEREAADSLPNYSRKTYPPG